jgi:hypothetical protein
MSQLGTIAMTSEEQEILQKQASRLTRLLEASNKFVGPSADPTPGSPMDRAKRAKLWDPYGSAYLLLFSAEDHLRAIMIILKAGPLPTFAFFSLLRAAADAVVRCKHLLDPTVTATERLARGLNERLDNLDERLKAHQTPAEQEHYDSQVMHLEDRAIANGITPVRKTSTSRIRGFNNAVKQDLELFTAYLPGSPDSRAFRLLSGYVHSKPWVQLQPKRAQPASDPDFLLVPVDLDVPLFGEVSEAILDIYDASIGHWLELAGNPPDVWTNAKKGAAP